jgi:hypothetical protein
MPTTVGRITLETVSASETEWTSCAAVAVTVMLTGDAVKGALTEAAKVSVEAAKEFTGEKLAVRPAGRPLIVNTGEPLNPLRGATAISLVVRDPRVTLSVAVEVDSVKSGGGRTWRFTLSE